MITMKMVLMISMIAMLIVIVIMMNIMTMMRMMIPTSLSRTSQLQVVQANKSTNPALRMRGIQEPST